MDTITPSQPSPMRPKWAPFLYAGEVLAVLLFVFWMICCGLSMSASYAECPALGVCVCISGLLYMAGVGASSRWAVAVPVAYALLLGLLAWLGLLHSASDWLILAWPPVIGVAAYCWHRRQGWLLPVAALVGLVSLVLQLTYEPWSFWFWGDSFLLALFLLEMVLRSVTTLLQGHYFYAYTVMRLWRKARRTASADNCQSRVNGQA